MRNLALVLGMTLVAATAAAQPEPTSSGSRGIGLGVEQNLGGLTGAALVYDAGSFHFDVLLGLKHYSNDGPDATFLGLGGRFFFVMHSFGMADFSIGGGLGILQSDVGDNSDTEIQIEGAAQIRLFLVPNVSITASLGLVFLTANDNNVGGGPVLAGGSGETALGIGGGLMGGFGLIYFFH